MKKYVNPKIEIKSFLCESIITASAPKPTYIPEVNSLQRFLGDTDDQFEKRMMSFNSIIELSE